MLVREKMVLAVFIVSVAFRAEPELQHIVVELGPAAHRAAMLGNDLLRSRGVHHAALALAGADALHVLVAPAKISDGRPSGAPRFSRREPEYQEVGDSHKVRDRNHQKRLRSEINVNLGELVYIVCPVEDSQVFHLDGDQEEQQQLYLTELHRKGEEHGQVDVLQRSTDRDSD